MDIDLKVPEDDIANDSNSTTFEEKEEELQTLGVVRETAAISFFLSFLRLSFAFLPVFSFLVGCIAEVQHELNAALFYVPW